MSENNCAVYVHVNLINGKKYFGVTVQEPEKRWRGGKGYSNNDHFTNAINKYGWENFAHFILYKDIPIKIAKNIEEMLIDEHMSYDPRFGYNLTHGGELERHSDETRRKISKNNAMKRPEVAEKQSKTLKEYYENNPEALEARIVKISKPVEAIDPESGQRALYFKSTMDAGRAGFDHRHVSACCRGKRKTHKGYIWRYVQEVSDDDTDSGQ